MLKFKMLTNYYGVNDFAKNVYTIYLK